MSVQTKSSFSAKKAFKADLTLSQGSFVIRIFWEAKINVYSSRLSQQKNNLFCEFKKYRLSFWQVLKKLLKFKPQAQNFLQIHQVSTKAH